MSSKRISRTLGGARDIAVSTVAKGSRLPRGDETTGVFEFESLSSKAAFAVYLLSKTVRASTRCTNLIEVTEMTVSQT